MTRHRAHASGTNRSHACRAIRHRSAQDAAPGAALPEPTALQHRARRRDPPFVLRGVVAHGTAHCLEAALFAATVLEQHGYPPLVLSFESMRPARPRHLRVPAGTDAGDPLRDRATPGCTAGMPVFGTARALARSYMEPYIDHTGGVRAYGVADLRVLAGTTGACRRRTCGRSSRCSSTIRIGRCPCRGHASASCGAGTRRSGRRTTTSSPWTTPTGTGGPNFQQSVWRPTAVCRDGPGDRTASIEVEVARGLRDRLGPCLLERFFEPARQHIFARPFSFDRLLEHRLHAGPLPRRSDSAPRSARDDGRTAARGG